MTREEITEKLKSLKADIVSCGGCEGKKDYAQALTETIEALQTEPREDAISRQAAIDAIWDDINMDIYTREIKEILEKLPSVNPRKVGKWIEKHGAIVCSECGWYAPRIETGCLANRHLEYHKSKYCWNCGAKMEEGDEE